VFGPDKDRGTNAMALGADIASVFVPCAAGAGMLVRAGRAVDNAGDAATAVYRSIDPATGAVQYVGITNDLARRQAEHLRHSGFAIEPLMTGLSRSDARAVEQALIEVHGLGKNGGTLLNRINSIARTNPTYASQLARGQELLRSIGYVP
jgi:hypothetical protein